MVEKYYAAGGAIVSNIGYGREEAEAVANAVKYTYVLPPFLTPERGLAG